MTCLQFDDTRIISGALDTLIKIWNIASGEVRCRYFLGTQQLLYSLWIPATTCIGNYSVGVHKLSVLFIGFHSAFEQWTGFDQKGIQEL